MKILPQINNAPLKALVNMCGEKSSPAKWPLGIILSLFLVGCQEIRIPWVYRIDIQQGNVITQAQLAKLESGMERRKVRFILGTPLVADAFNQDRWDYYYSFEPGNGEREQRIISVFFDKKGLIRVDGDVRAAKGPIKIAKKPDLLVTVPPGLNDDSIFASLTPSFLSKKKKSIDLSKLAKSRQKEPTAVKDESTKAPEVEITTADQQFLEGLLKGYGLAQESGENSALASTEQSNQKPGPEAQNSEDQSTSESESFLTRWAKKLGIKAGNKQDKKSEPAQAQPTPDASSD